VAQFVARDPDTDGLVGAAQAPRDPRLPSGGEQSAAGNLELGPEVVQVLLQRVVERNAGADEPVAVID
jgi:hypothetical protein